MSELTFTFDGGVSTDYGLIVTGIRRAAAAPRSMVTQDVPGMPGTLHMGNVTGAGAIAVDVRLSATDDSDAQSKLDALTAWLVTDTARALSLSDRPGRFSYALLDGSTDLDQFLQRFRTTFVFACPNPHSWATDELETALVVGDNAVSNPGGIAVTPRLELTFASAATFLRAECGDRYMQIGVAAEATETPVPATSVMMHDDCSSLTGWGAGSEGTITGAMGCNGLAFGPTRTGGAFGTGSGWHGPSIQKAFPAVDGSAVAQDFLATIRCGLDNRIAANAKGEARYSMAAIWAYFMNADGDVIASWRLADAWRDVTQVQADFQLGSAAFGSGLRTTGPKKTSYNNYTGRMKVQRIGNVYTFTACTVNSSGVETNSKHAHYTDAAGTYDDPIARVELHIAKYAGTNACADEYVTQIDVLRINDTSTDPAVNVVEAGDTIVLDGWQIRRNGALYAVSLDPLSDALLVPPGDSDLTIWTDGTLVPSTLLG